jgi:hypothetical protein
MKLVQRVLLSGPRGASIVRLGEEQAARGRRRPRSARAVRSK